MPSLEQQISVNGVSPEITCSPGDTTLVFAESVTGPKAQFVLEWSPLGSTQFYRLSSQSREVNIAGFLAEGDRLRVRCVPGEDLQSNSTGTAGFYLRTF